MDPEIHEMLRQYSCKFYTTDYVSFTESVVAEAILDLKAVPLTDFGCLTILPDPLSALSQLLSLPTQSPYDEVPQTTKDGLEYLKRELALHGSKTKLQLRTFTDEPEQIPPPEPFLPVISRSSQKKTPLLNKSMNKFRAESHASLLTAQGITRMKDPEESPLSVEDILYDFGYKLDEQTAPAVRTLLQSTANMIRPYKNWKNPHLDTHSIAADVGGDIYEFPRIEFLPIFPRVPPEVLKKATDKKKNVTFNLPTTHKELSLEFGISENAPSYPSPSRQNLVIVDGWETIHSSPPSIPSSQDDEIDELDPICMASTPEDKPARVSILAKAQMIPVAIPRCREIGGTSGLTPHILQNKTVSSFLGPLLSQPKVNEVEPERAQIGSPNASMVGHASSQLATKEPRGLYDMPEDLDKDIEGLYGDQSSPFKLILSERLDDIRFNMMDVPDLPEPNEHAPNPDFLVPTSLIQLLVSKDEDRSNNNKFAFLEKTKGQRALALSLSWVSFTTTEKLPTISQIVGVDDLDLQRIQPQVEHVLTFLNLADDYSPLHESATRQDNFRSSYNPPSLTNDFQLLLTRQEIKRVAKRTGAAQPSSSSDDGTTDFGIATSRGFKRPRLDSDSPAMPRQFTQILGSQQLPPSSPPLLTPSDDSGIVLNDKLMMSDYRGCTPPFSSYLSYTSPKNVAPVSLEMDLRDDEDFMDCEPDFAFHPLSLESYPLNPAPDDEEIPHVADHIEVMEGGMSQISQAPDQRDPLAALGNSRLAQNSLIGIFDFARLRGKRVSQPVPLVQEPIVAAQPAIEHPIPSCRAPGELADKNTLLLPYPELQPSSLHRYLGSLDIIQKRGLVLALQSPQHLVDISERESLSGADLVLDPYSAIIIFSLFTLPARSETYLARVCAQSWKFKKVYVIFEAFPESWARLTNRQDDISEVSAYTPHILKAIRRFRRDVEVAAACGTRDVECVVKYAFADTVNEAASYVRLCGDIAESEDTTDGQLWSEREWMTWNDRHEDEYDLAYASGINSFSAALLLCHNSIGNLLSMSSEERLEHFGPYIGRDAVVKFNADIHRRQNESEISTCGMV